VTRDHLHGHGHQPKCDKGGWSLEACTCLTARLQLNREFDYVSPVTLKEALIEDKSKIGLAIHFVFNTYTAVEATRYSTQIIWRARGVALELCGGYIPNIQKYLRLLGDVRSGHQRYPGASLLSSQVWWALL